MSANRKLTILWDALERFSEDTLQNKKKEKVGGGKSAMKEEQNTREIPGAPTQIVSVSRFTPL